MVLDFMGAEARKVSQVKTGTGQVKHFEVRTSSGWVRCSSGVVQPGGSLYYTLGKSRQGRLAQPADWCSVYTTAGVGKQP